MSRVTSLGSGAVGLQPLEVASFRLGRGPSHTGLGRSWGLQGGLDIVVHVPGGGDLEAGLGCLQGSLGYHHATMVNGQESVAPRPQLRVGPVDLWGDGRYVGKGMESPS